MFRQLLLLIHLLSAMAWIGGMAFAYLYLRPAAAEVLQPPQRLPLWTATFARFLPSIAFAVALLLASGLTMFLHVGFQKAPPGWSLMFGLGVVMAAIFSYVYGVLFPKLRAHVAAAAWPEAAQTLNHIRQLVAVNLVLGVVTVAAAVSAR
jgi:uncharacterized membrane protein